MWERGRNEIKTGQLFFVYLFFLCVFFFFFFFCIIIFLRACPLYLSIYRFQPFFTHLYTSHRKILFTHTHTHTLSRSLSLSLSVYLPSSSPSCSSAFSPLTFSSISLHHLLSVFSLCIPSPNPHLYLLSLSLAPSHIMTLLRETFDINNIHPILVVVVVGGGRVTGGLVLPFLSQFSLPLFFLLPTSFLLPSSLLPLYLPFCLPSPSPLSTLSLPPFPVSLPLSHALSPPPHLHPCSLLTFIEMSRGHFENKYDSYKR